jgi:hypothetical protein
MNLGHVSPLAGRVFVATSGNIAKTQYFGPGGIGVSWGRSPTTEDIAQFEQWALSVLGYDAEVHSEINRNLREGEEAYRKWLGGTDSKASPDSPKEPASGE